MAWIKKINEREATGVLREFYKGVSQQLGFVPNIVKAYSLRRDVLVAFEALYEALMFGPSGLSRVQREMIATVVSKFNRCHY